MKTLTAYENPDSVPQIKRDRWGRYLLPDPKTGEDKSWMRVTTFAKSISDTFALGAHQQKMVAKGLTMRKDLFALASATHIDDRQAWGKICEDAKEAAGAKRGANEGTALHSLTESYDRGLEVNVPDYMQSDYKAYVDTIQSSGLMIYKDMIERTVVNSEYGLAGTFDRIARMPDRTLAILDLKTGKDLSYAWLEIGIQLACYANSTHIWNSWSGFYSPMPALDKSKGVVVHLPVGKGKCTLYEIDLVQGWEDAQLCSKVRERRKVKTSASVFGSRKPDITPPATIRKVSTVKRIKEAPNLPVLKALRQELIDTGKWTPVHEALARTRINEL